MDRVEDVALLALLYREHYRARHTCPDDLFVDFECCRGEVSLATLVGSHVLQPLDWFVIRSMHRPESLSDLAARLDPLRAEALLHVWPAEAPPPEGEWTLPFGADRWNAVVQAMEGFRAEGLTASRDDVELVASSVYGAVTGRTYDDYLNEYADTIFAG